MNYAEKIEKAWNIVEMAEQQGCDDGDLYMAAVELVLDRPDRDAEEIAALLVFYFAPRVAKIKTQRDQEA